MHWKYDYLLPGQRMNKSKFHLVLKLGSNSRHLSITVARLKDSTRLGANKIYDNRYDIFIAMIGMVKHRMK